MAEFEQKQHGRLRNRCGIDLPSTDQEPGSCKLCYHSPWPGKLVNSVDDGSVMATSDHNMPGLQAFKNSSEATVTRQTVYFMDLASDSNNTRKVM